MAVTPERWSWQQLPNESTKAYEAFVSYLRLEKRGNNPKRYATDLVPILGLTQGRLSQWLQAHRWEERAAEYDAELFKKPDDIAELAERRRHARELRFLGRSIRRVGLKALRKLDQDMSEEDYHPKPDDVVKFLKFGTELEKQAQNLESPAIRQKKEALAQDIRTLYIAIQSIQESATGGSGNMAGRSSRRVLPAATEAEYRESDSGGSAGESDFGLLEVSATPGEVHPAGIGADALGEAGGTLSGGSGE